MFCNHSSYLPEHYLRVQSVSLTYLEIHANVMNGGFSWQIGHKNTLGSIPMDQIIEETINKDMQTRGGTKRNPKILLQNIISLQMTVPTMCSSSYQCYKRKTISLRILI